ncbi:MAG TPA: MBL fold metallo-hydrolase [Candidatus Limnocylindrales bacterium]|nr:MBL fold metallo-hydrolase [Candidatus Limnocylindrales bacterium]
MRILRIFVALVAGLLVVAGTWLAWQWNLRPSVYGYASELAIAPADSAAGADGLRVTFLGVSTLLFRDAKTAVMTDGFFTRPGLVRTALGRIEPDAERIDAALKMAGIEHLDAIVTGHSHYDHAMDTADVASRTGAVIVGSESTANTARGRDFPESRIHVVRGTETLSFGDLTVTVVPSRHFPHGQGMGEITRPLATPARVTEYLEGGSFSIFVERAGRTALVQSSAGYVEGALAGRKADVVFLGIGLLGTKDDAYRDAYWRETVAAVGAKRVIPIHWDDFTRGLEQPLVALPFLLDRVDVAMAFVRERAGRDRIDVRWPAVAEPFDPFEGLAAAASSGNPP